MWCALLMCIVRCVFAFMWYLSSVYVVCVYCISGVCTKYGYFVVCVYAVCVYVFYVVCVWYIFGVCIWYICLSSCVLCVVNVFVLCLYCIWSV